MEYVVELYNWVWIRSVTLRILGNLRTQHCTNIKQYECSKSSLPTNNIAAEFVLLVFCAGDTMCSESRCTLHVRWLVKRGFQFAFSLPDDALVLRDYHIYIYMYHDKAVMTNMLLQTLSSLLF